MISLLFTLFLVPFSHSFSVSAYLNLTESTNPLSDTSTLCFDLASPCTLGYFTGTGGTTGGILSNITNIYPGITILVIRFYPGEYGVTGIVFDIPKEIVLVRVTSMLVDELGPPNDVNVTWVEASPPLTTTTTIPTPSDSMFIFDGGPSTLLVEHIELNSLARSLVYGHASSIPPGRNLQTLHSIILSGLSVTSSNTPLVNLQGSINLPAHILTLHIGSCNIEHQTGPLISVNQTKWTTEGLFGNGLMITETIVDWVQLRLDNPCLFRLETLEGSDMMRVLITDSIFRNIDVLSDSVSSFSSNQFALEDPRLIWVHSETSSSIMCQIQDSSFSHLLHSGVIGIDSKSGEIDFLYERNRLSESCVGTASDDENDDITCQFGAIHLAAMGSVMGEISLSSFSQSHAWIGGVLVFQHLGGQGIFGLAMSRNNFTGNQASFHGSAIALQSQHPDLINVTVSSELDIFKNNIGGEHTGVVFIQSVVPVDLSFVGSDMSSNAGTVMVFQVFAFLKVNFDGVGFIGNSGAREGTVFWFDTICLTEITVDFTATMCDFQGNYADEVGSIIAFAGAVMPKQKFLFTECTFVNNSASERGGALSLQGKNVAQTQVEIFGCQFEGNSAGQFGAAAYLQAVDISIHGQSIFSGNTAGKAGGAIYSDLCELDIIETLFISNQALYGGAVWSQDTVLEIGDQATIRNNIAQIAGGGLYVDKAVTRFELAPGQVIEENVAEFGGGVFVDGKPTILSLAGQITRNSASLGGGGIFWLNPEAAVDPGPTVLHENTSPDGREMLTAPTGLIYDPSLPESFCLETSTKNHKEFLCRFTSIAFTDKFSAIWTSPFFQEVVLGFNLDGERWDHELKNPQMIEVAVAMPHDTFGIQQIQVSLGSAMVQLPLKFPPKKNPLQKTNWGLAVSSLILFPLGMCCVILIFVTLLCVVLKWNEIYQRCLLRYRRASIQ